MIKRSKNALNFPNLSLDTFLKDYWQKKPLLIRNAFKHFDNPLSPDELAGLALEEEIESRLVIQTPDKSPQWTLKHGPFTKHDFKKLPKSHWTLLVQGVDRFVPEVAALLDHFNFIPQWRIDDVMISFATQNGGVGPHYDHYDVFLYQAKGRRQWLLTSQDCNTSNFLPDLPLRIMKEFKVEHEYVLEEGDMLYVPPLVGHHGTSLSDDCMTYSFGYRSYQGQELWQSFGDYLASKNKPIKLYQDPLWQPGSAPSALPEDAWQQAKGLMQAMLEDEDSLRDWFACFVTGLDEQAELLLPGGDGEGTDIEDFRQALLGSQGLLRNALCRFGYVEAGSYTGSKGYTGSRGLAAGIRAGIRAVGLYVNGCGWDVEGVTPDLVRLVANQRRLLLTELLPFLDKPLDLSFLHALWQEQLLELLDHDLC